MTGRRFLGYAALVVAMALIGLFFWPGSLEPVAWNPPEAPPLVGLYQPNTRLQAVERIGTGVDWGPADVAVDRAGRIYTGVEGGRIVRFEPDGRRYRSFVETGGRPLGLDFDSHGNLVVADAGRGLLLVTPKGETTVLAKQVGGAPLGLLDGVDVAGDGTVYFTEASSKFSPTSDFLDVIEHGPNGRLLSYQPVDRKTVVLLDGLHFAGGVAVSPDQAFVLVSEMTEYRIRRLWLKGPKKGQSDVFIENLPGFPDGISSNGRSTFWVALVTSRDSRLDAVLPYPRLRRALLRLGQLPLEPRRYGFVLGLDADGRVVFNLQDPTGTHYDSISSVREHNGMLYLGSRAQDSIGRLPVP